MKKKPSPPSPITSGITDPLHLSPHQTTLRRLALTVGEDGDAKAAVANALAGLRATYVKLTDIPDADIKAMKDDERADWAGTADALFRNIRKLESAQLQILNQEFQARASELASATLSLQVSLEGLNKITEIVKAITSGLTLITNIVALLA